VNHRRRDDHPPLGRRREPPVNLAGVLSIRQLARLLYMSQDSIRDQIKAGTFPIPTLPRSLGRRYRWSGPIVQRYLEQNGELELDAVDR
jgi:predicted DNA-binding transcriptional regulator AlpA